MARARKKATKKTPARKLAKKVPARPATMELWDKVCETPQEWKTGSFEGDSFSAVKPILRIRQATELWGPQGGLWKVETTYELVKVPAGRTAIAVVADVNVAFPGGRVQDIRAGAWLINLSGTVDLNAWKSARTLALGKALSQVGFGADLHARPGPPEKTTAAKPAQPESPREARPASAPVKTSTFVDVAGLPF